MAALLCPLPSSPIILAISSPGGQEHQRTLQQYVCDTDCLDSLCSNNSHIPVAKVWLAGPPLAARVLDTPLAGRPTSTHIQQYSPLAYKMWPFSSWSESRLINDTITSKRNQRAEAIAQGLKVANANEAATADEDLEYLSASAAHIASRVRSREWTARRVMEAYVRSAVRAHSRTNCLTEIMFVHALDEADRLDDFIKNASSEQLDEKLLLGVPTTLKDQLDYKGVDSSRGFVRYALLRQFGDPQSRWRLPPCTASLIF